MQNAGLDELQAGIKGASKKQNLRYVDDITLMVDISLLMRVKEESEEADLKFNIRKTKIMPLGPITSWQIERKKVEAVTDFIFLDSKSLQTVSSVQFSSVQSLSRVRLFETPWTAAYQAPPSMGLTRQEYWSGVPLPSPMHI